MAQHPYPFDGVTRSPLSDHYLYLCDTNNNLQLEQALNKFAGGEGLHWPALRTFNVGIKPFIYWFKFSAINSSQTDQQAVYRISTSLAAFHIYRVDSAGRIAVLFQGTTETPYAQRPFKHRDIAIPLTLRPGETVTLLFNVDKRNRGLYMPMYFLSLEETLRTELRHHWVYGWHFGIYLFIILFNIFLFFSLKDPIHLWYAAYIVCAILFMFEDEKFFVEYFPDSWIRFFETAGTFPFSLLLLACGIRVMQLLLQQERKNSLFFLPATVLANASIILAAVLFVDAIPDSAAALRLMVPLHTAVDVLVGLSLLVLLASSIEKLVRRQLLAGYYLLATAFPFFGALIYYLNHFGITNFNPIQPNGIVTGITLEIMFLSCLLVIRYNRLKRDKLELQEKISLQERELVLKVLDAQEVERKRLALDLHDDLGGTLNALKLHISRKNEVLPELGDAEKEYHAHSLKLVSRASEDLRSVAHNLLPKDFSRIGLVKTIQNTLYLFERSTPIRFNLITEGDLDLIGEMHSVIIYRIVNEMVNNIVRHSHASEATIQLLQFNGSLQIIAEDNGVGFGAGHSTDGIGLANIRSRVAFLRGQIHIESNAGGTSIIINIPLNIADHAE